MDKQSNSKKMASERKKAGEPEVGECLVVATTGARQEAKKKKIDLHLLQQNEYSGQKITKKMACVLCCQNLCFFFFFLSFLRLAKFCCFVCTFSKKKITDINKPQNEKEKSNAKPVKTRKAQDMAAQVFDDNKTAYAKHSTYQYTYHLNNSNKRSINYEYPSNKKQVQLNLSLCVYFFFLFEIHHTYYYIPRNITKICLEM